MIFQILHIGINIAPIFIMKTLMLNVHFHIDTNVTKNKSVYQHFIKRWPNKDAFEFNLEIN